MKSAIIPRGGYIEEVKMENTAPKVLTKFLAFATIVGIIWIYRSGTLDPLFS